MLVEIAWIMTLVFATTLVHTLCTIGLFFWFRWSSAQRWATQNVLTRAATLAAIVIMMSFAAYAEALIYALFYVTQGALANLEDAVYFSLVTFTTLGYGDITLASGWRVIGAVEAANGIILFGWTTAIIVAVGQRVFAEANGSTDPSLETEKRP